MVNTILTNWLQTNSITLTGSSRVARNNNVVDIGERFGLFDQDGTLADDGRKIWSLIEPEAENIARAFARRFAAACNKPDDAALQGHLIRLVIPYLAARFPALDQQKWVDLAGQLAAAGAKMAPLTAITSGISAGAAHIQDIVAKCLIDEPEQLARISRALTHSTLLEVDVFSAHHDALRLDEERARRRSQGEALKTEIISVVERTAGDSKKLRTQASEASGAARGMLGKTSEVAAAAEQSAVAMREAAQTAAGLILAIEDARSEVEVAAGVATRAGDQAAQAVQVSQALSAHVEAIESILGLIRDIAGQTNLLALNATIEAARAGDAGRGFAVVAQEVKSLASQTARATDDITAKINAIQSATRQTVDANGSIQSTVEEVQTSADRIRRAMEMQAQTVTMITAAVDETALAADSMSSTIASIRSDTENVASEIDEVEKSFSEVDQQMARFQATAAKFVQNLAA